MPIFHSIRKILISIAIVDDEPLFSAGLEMIIDTQNDMETTWTATDGEQAVRRSREKPPDILLLDIQMPYVDGLTAMRRILSEHDFSPISVIILTTFDHDEYILNAIEEGASGFIVKNTHPEQLLSAIRAVSKGEAVISQSVTKALFSIFQAKRKPDPTDKTVSADLKKVEMLSQREREIVALVAEGLSNQEIADSLFLSLPTVKTHIASAMTKTSLHRRIQLALFALRTGVASLDS